MKVIEKRISRTSALSECARTHDVSVPVLVLLSIIRCALGICLTNRSMGFISLSGMGVADLDTCMDLSIW